MSDRWLPWWGYALLSAVFAALTTILAKLGVKDINSNLATAIRVAVILPLAWGIVVARGELTGLNTISRPTLLFLVLSAFATGLSWIFYFRALQLGQAAQVAPIDKSSLALVLVLSALILGEPFTWKTLAATVLVTAGTLVLLF